jgi:hypothetical protein
MDLTWVLKKESTSSSLNLLIFIGELLPGTTPLVISSLRTLDLPKGDSNYSLNWTTLSILDLFTLNPDFSFTFSSINGFSEITELLFTESWFRGRFSGDRLIFRVRFFIFFYIPHSSNVLIT